MKNLKKLLTTVSLLGIIIIGATNAKAGLLMSDFASTNDEKTEQCVQNNNEKEDDEKLDHGVIVDLTGVIVDFTGVIVDLTGVIVDFKGSTTECGVIVD